MFRTFRFSLGPSVAFLLVLLLPVEARLVAQAPQVPGAIRSRVVLVPIDVRVVDRQGNPVTDLKPEDFTILEDGVRQDIRHFSTQALTAMADPADVQPALRRSAGLEADPVQHRTFLLVLGRGRLHGPSRGLQALTKFVREDLLPQDHVGVLAYGRVTDLTRDRASVVRFLEEYAERHGWVEALLDHWFQGLTALYGSRENPPGAQARIDALFDAPGLPPSREVVLMQSPGDGEFERARRLADASLDWDRGRGWDPELGPSGFIFDVAAWDDMEKLHAAVEYLRYFQGEKHVVFLTEWGVQSVLPRNFDRLAAMAADARVTISPIHVGGLGSYWSGGMLSGPSWAERWAKASSRGLAHDTGGTAAIHEYASAPLSRLDRATRFQYLLGYYPSNASWDGSERRVRVRVNRRDVEVMHRFGYYAREDLVPYDHREFLGHSRVMSAGAYRAELSDVTMVITADPVRTDSGQWQIDVRLRIDPATVRFTERDGRYVASLDVGLFAGARGRREIGDLHRRVDLSLAPDQHAALKTDGIVVSATLDVKDRPRYLKAVVYDYPADRLGSRVIELR